MLVVSLAHLPNQVTAGVPAILWTRHPPVKSKIRVP